jgi:hypothetical protein
LLHEIRDRAFIEVLDLLSQAKWDAAWRTIWHFMPKFGKNQASASMTVQTQPSVE